MLPDLLTEVFNVSFVDLVLVAFALDEDLADVAKLECSVNASVSGVACVSDDVDVAVLDDIEDKFFKDEGIDFSQIPDDSRTTIVLPGNLDQFILYSARLLDSVDVAELAKQSDAIEEL